MVLDTLFNHIFFWNRRWIERGTKTEYEIIHVVRRVCVYSVGTNTNLLKTYVGTKI